MANSPGRTGLRTTLTTSWPDLRRWVHSAWPIVPLDPVITTCMVVAACVMAPLSDLLLPVPVLRKRSTQRRRRSPGSWHSARTKKTCSTPTLLRLLTSGQLDGSHFVTHHFELDQMLEAYDAFGRAAETGALKVVISR